MAYSEVGIVNLALGRLGEKGITAAEWASPSESQTEAASNIWEYIRDLVLEARDWYFARTRTTLSKIPPRVDLDCGEQKHLYIEADEWQDDTLDISIELTVNTSDALSVAIDASDAQNIQVKLANATSSNNTAALI